MNCVRAYKLHRALSSVSDILISMPVGLRFLSVGYDSCPVIYMLGDTNPAPPRENRRFLIVCSEYQFDAETWKYLGSCQDGNGLPFHIFEEIYGCETSPS